MATTTEKAVEAVGAPVEKVVSAVVGAKAIAKVPDWVWALASIALAFLALRWWQRRKARLAALGGAPATVPTWRGPTAITSVAPTAPAVSPVVNQPPPGTPTQVVPPGALPKVALVGLLGSGAPQNFIPIGGVGPGSPPGGPRGNAGNWSIS